MVKVIVVCSSVCSGSNLCPNVHVRGVGLGVTSQLSSTITSINMSGFKFGSGANALLLGTNVIGSIIAWALMFITLLENPLGSTLTKASKQGAHLTLATTMCV